MGAAEKIQFLLETDVIDRAAGQQLQGVDDLFHIVDDELLGAEQGALVQGRLAHAAHIAVDTLVQGKQQAAVVVAGPQGAQPVQTDADGNVVELG